MEKKSPALMSHFHRQVKKKKTEFFRSPSTLFKNEEGAIDLASIMVGVVVIGVIGGVVAATVFAVVPWTQDNSAKQQLDTINSAQSAYYGLSSSANSLPQNHKMNSYANSIELKEAGLLEQGSNYCSVKTGDGTGYQAFVYSASGRTWTVSNSNTEPSEFNEKLPKECNSIAPFHDDTPTLTTLTYNCVLSSKTGTLPLNSNLKGTETWSDGVKNSYNGESKSKSRTLLQGVEYKVTFDGTYTSMNSALDDETVALADCLQSVDHWGMKTGATTAEKAFYKATHLKSVPERVPETITSFDSMFAYTTLNDSNLSSWNTSNVTNMSWMFYGATTFDQPLNAWNTSKVTDMNNMFGLSSFNQPLDKWDTSKVTDMSSMFALNLKFNQPLNSWDTSSVKTFNGTFSFASFNQPLDKWNVSNAENMNMMFGYNEAFNQPLSSWKTGKVTDMGSMFFGSKYNQNISNWDTSSLLNSIMFAPPSFPSNYLPPRISK